MTQEEFAKMMCDRTKDMAVRVIKLVQSLPNKPEYWVIGKQILRSGTSTAANYRAVTRARSDREFFAKLSITVEECDETLLWLELLEEADLIDATLIADLKDEVTQILKIISKARKTASNNRKSNK